jgi:hypothetical protein
MRASKIVLANVEKMRMLGSGETIIVSRLRERADILQVAALPWIFSVVLLAITRSGLGESYGLFLLADGAHFSAS